MAYNLAINYQTIKKEVYITHYNSTPHQGILSFAHIFSTLKIMQTVGLSKKNFSLPAA